MLLAPLGASFDQFKDYRERAAVFRRVVASLKNEWHAAKLKSESEMTESEVTGSEVTGSEVAESKNIELEDAWTYR